MAALSTPRGLEVPLHSLLLPNRGITSQALSGAVYLPEDLDFQEFMKQTRIRESLRDSTCVAAHVRGLGKLPLLPNVSARKGWEPGLASPSCPKKQSRF